MAAAVITALAFVPALSLRYVGWDDDILLQQNEAFRGFGAEQLGWMFSTTLAGHYQPITWLSYAFDHAVWGMDPYGYHLTNVLLHAAAAAGLAWCSHTLLARAVPGLDERPRTLAICATAAALLWSVHPLRVESVAWLAERRDVLSGALLFLSLACWLRYVRDDTARHRRVAYAAALVLYAIALLAKASSMAWPLVLLILDAWPLRRRVRIVEKLPFFVPSLASAGYGWLGQAVSDSFVGSHLGFLDRVALVGHSVSFYPLKTLLPLGLRGHYARPLDFDPFAPILVVAGFLALACTAFVWSQRKRRPALLATWGAYLVLLAPISGAFPVSSVLVTEHYSYLPCAVFGVLVAGAAGAAVLRGRLRGSTVNTAATILVMLLVYSSGRQCARWTDTGTLFREVLEHAPDDWMAHAQLGRLASLDGRLDEAQRHYETSIALGYDAASSHAHLGWIAARRGDRRTAEREVLRALELDANHVLAWTVRGTLAQQAGDLAAAESCLLAALRGDPQRAMTHHNLGRLRLLRGDPRGAEAALRESVRLDPRRIGALADLGALFEQAGDLPGAAEQYRAVLALDPMHAGARAGLERCTGK